MERPISNFKEFEERVHQQWKAISNCISEPEMTAILEKSLQKPSRGVPAHRSLVNSIQDDLSSYWNTSFVQQLGLREKYETLQNLKQENSECTKPAWRPEAGNPEPHNLHSELVNEKESLGFAIKSYESQLANLDAKLQKEKQRIRTEVLENKIAELQAHLIDRIKTTESLIENQINNIKAI